MKMTQKVLFPLMTLAVLVACGSHSYQDIKVNPHTVRPGQRVTMMGKDVELYKGSLKEGDNLNKILKETGLNSPSINQVSVVNIVPSVDTKVCEAQTHILGETDKLAKGIGRVTISRDLPMAHDRFAREAELKNIRYLSDYKSGAFGKKTGLMMKNKELLARAVLVVDEKGIVRHLQVVPEVAELPDMDKAFAEANKLFREKSP